MQKGIQVWEDKRLMGHPMSLGQMEGSLKAVGNFECDEKGSNVLKSIKRLSLITNMIWISTSIRIYNDFLLHVTVM